MADYSGAYTRTPTAAEREVATLRLENRRLAAELQEYKEKDLADRMKRLKFSESKVEGYVECDYCAGLFSVERMQFHRDRCQ